MGLHPPRSLLATAAQMIASLFSFVGRHGVASLISVVLPVGLVILLYFILFVVALVTNSDWGSPIALPLWAMFTLIGSLTYTGVLLFPSVAIAEAFAQPLGKWKHIAQIPLSTLLLALLASGLVALVGLLNQSPLNLNQWLTYSGYVFLAFVIPLGIYWGSMKFTQAILFAITLPIKWLGQIIVGKA